MEVISINYVYTIYLQVVSLNFEVQVVQLRKFVALNNFCHSEFSMKHLQPNKLVASFVDVNGPQLIQEVLS